jgi:hypothetical protein
MNVDEVVFRSSVCNICVGRREYNLGSEILKLKNCDELMGQQRKTLALEHAKTKADRVTWISKCVSRTV